MNVNGIKYKTLWLCEKSVKTINQKLLPFEFKIEEYYYWRECLEAIKDMTLRGAPLIGAAGVAGLWLSSIEYSKDDDYKNLILKAADELREARPTAVNLAWAIDAAICDCDFSSPDSAIDSLKDTAERVISEEEEASRLIGENGFQIIQELYNQKKRKLNILTHCNAGWLATIDYGTALAPVYRAFDSGLPLSVWVDETRPRNQGAKLTAWELASHGIEHYIIVDNAGGLLAARGEIDLMIVGCDRMTSSGDAINKIGTYLKALAAKDNNIPFCVALPSSTIDWSIENPEEIIIEERDEREVKLIEAYIDGQIREIPISNLSSPAKNYGFDITPRRLIDWIITDKGISRANNEELLKIYPERRK